MTDEPDLIREALQVRVNDEHSGYLVVHYVAVVGLHRISADGDTETTVVVARPSGQATYITHGLICEAPEVLAELEFDDAEADCEDETD